MKILIVHNYYRSLAPSGEDYVFRNEIDLLKKNSIHVITYERNNDDLFAFNKKLTAPFNLIWSQKSYWEIKQLIKKEKPDIAHFHNIFYLISPSAYYACQDSGVRVIQTLHNYRFFCINGLLFRDGKVCQKCIGKSSFNGCFYGCYRNSRLFSLPLAIFEEFHIVRKTWQNKINLFLSLSYANKHFYIDSGFPEKNIYVKPNFLPNPPAPEYKSSSYIVFVGRLAREKGINVLLDAFKILNKGKTNIHLKILGSGPDQNFLEEKIKKGFIKNVDFIGRKVHSDVLENIKNSMALVMPSIWNETFGLSAIEAYACGKPVIASKIGSLSEIVRDGKTGLLFEPGDPIELASKIQWVVENPDACVEMGRNARKEFEEKYTEERNYKMLMNIYEKVLERKA